METDESIIDCESTDKMKTTLDKLAEGAFHYAPIGQDGEVVRLTMDNVTEWTIKD